MIRDLIIFRHGISTIRSDTLAAVTCDFVMTPSKSNDNVASLTDSFTALTMVDQECVKHGDGSRTPCCVCQEEPVNPVELPCSHIFCFLCIKGVAARSGACALCRKRIPHGYLESPSVVNSGFLQSRLQTPGADRFHWFYEGKNGGWWMYEDRTSNDIEKAFMNKVKTLKVQISGFMYSIDFESMMQIREDHPSRKRKIKRDTVSSAGVKGVAGIFVDGLKK